MPGAAADTGPPGVSTDATVTTDSGVPDAATPPADEAPPFDPKPPYLSGAACQACLSDGCKAELTACQATEACIVLRDALREEPNVAAINALTVKPLPPDSVSFSESAWMRDHGEPDVHAPVRALNVCMNRQCREACDLGRYFACTGKFDFPRPFPEVVTHRFALADAITLTGCGNVGVRACYPQSSCDPALAMTTTDAKGRAELAVPLPRNLNQLPFYDGYLLFDETTDLYPHSVQLSLPVIDGAYRAYGVFTKIVIDASYRAAGEVFSPDRGLFLVQPYDCVGNGAKHVTVEMWVVGSSEYRFCDECGISYTRDDGYPDPSRQEISGDALVAYVRNVPPGNLIVIVRDTATRGIVGFQRVVARAGYTHTTAPYPPSSRQVRDIPRETL